LLLIITIKAAPHNVQNDFKKSMEYKYKIGQEVCSKNAPTVKLVVSNFNQRIYFCSYPYNPAKKDLTLREDEILPFFRKRI